MADSESKPSRAEGPTTERAAQAKAAKILARLKLRQDGEEPTEASVLTQMSETDQDTDAEKRHAD